MKIWIKLSQVVALLAVFFTATSLRAQPTEETVDSRILFIFGTSSDMKARAPQVQTFLRTIFFAEVSGRERGKLRAGDSIGAWTLGTELRTGEFPLVTWEADKAGEVLTNLVGFADKQHYSKVMTLEQAMPKLDRLVKKSERLTVIVFCDGKSELHGTPFDAGFNQVFKDHAAETKKNKTPFVIILRSQLGEYVDGAINYTQGKLNMPLFPALPEPPPKPVEPPPAPPTNLPPPVVIVPPPPLVIVGTNVGTNIATLPPIKPKEEPTNTVAVAPTNPPPPVVTNVVFIQPPATPPPAPGLSSETALAIGGGLFAVAVLLGILAWRHSHRSSSSLITRSLKNRH